MKVSEECIRYVKKLVFLSGIIFTLTCCTAPVKKDLQTEIDSIAFRFVPDKRLGICNISLKPTTNKTLIITGETTSLPAKTEIIKTLYNQGISLIDSIVILPDTSNSEKYLGLVTLSVINLRKNPDHRAELVSQAILGTPVIVLKSKSSWLLVKTPDNYIAWTEKSSLSMKSRSEMNRWKKSERVIYLENSGWIFNGPGQLGIVSDLVAGCIMEKTGESHGYTGVVLPDGRTGEVPAKAVISFDTFRRKAPADADGVLNRAVSLLGVPYLWGGTSTKGVDCSGFVQTVFFMNGRILTRDASLQALHGQKIDLSEDYGNLRKGDLLFFGSKENSAFHVTHVALYMGDSEYINASGRVIINSLDSTHPDYNNFRKSTLLLARRIIGVESDSGIVSVINHAWY
jgi:cell wall-associated NlpC family hydrolase